MYRLSVIMMENKITHLYTDSTRGTSSNKKISGMNKPDRNKDDKGTARQQIDKKKYIREDRIRSAIHKKCVVHNVEMRVP